MKAEEREELLHPSPSRRSVAITNPSRATPQPLPPTKPPVQIPMVHVSSTPQDQGDEYITQHLLQSCIQGDIYQCPRCIFTTPSPEDMINHLADEINRSMDELGRLYQQRKPAHGFEQNTTP